VQHFEILKSTAFHIGNFPLKVYRLLQHLSSILGLYFVYRWIKHWYQHAEQTHTASWQPTDKLRKIALLTLFIAPLLFGLYYAISLMDREGPLAYRSMMFARDLVIFGGKLLLPLWLMMGLYYQWLIRKQHIQTS
jgi:hypothetical protein